LAKKPQNDRPGVRLAEPEKTAEPALVPLPSNHAERLRDSRDVKTHPLLHPLSSSLQVFRDEMPTNGARRVAVKEATPRAGAGVWDQVLKSTGALSNNLFKTAARRSMKKNTLLERTRQAIAAATDRESSKGAASPTRQTLVVRKSTVWDQIRAMALSNGEQDSDTGALGKGRQLTRGATASSIATRGGDGKVEAEEVNHLASYLYDGELRIFRQGELLCPEFFQVGSKTVKCSSTAKCIASEGTVTLSVSRATFDAAVASEMRKIEQNHASFVRSALPGFALMKEASAEKVVKLWREEAPCSRGAKVCEAGWTPDTLDSVCLVRSGSCKLIFPQGAKMVKEIAVVSEGSMLLSASQLLGMPEPFTVLVQSAKAQLLSVRTADLRKWLPAKAWEELLARERKSYDWRMDQIAKCQDVSDAMADALQQRRRQRPQPGGPIKSAYLRNKPCEDVLVAQQFKNWAPMNLTEHGDEVISTSNFMGITLRYNDKDESAEQVTPSEPDAVSRGVVELSAAPSTMPVRVVDGAVWSSEDLQRCAKAAAGFFSSDDPVLYRGNSQRLKAAIVSKYKRPIAPSPELEPRKSDKPGHPGWDTVDDREASLSRYGRSAERLVRAPDNVDVNKSVLGSGQRAVETRTTLEPASWFLSVDEAQGHRREDGSKGPAHGHWHWSSPAVPKSQVGLFPGSPVRFKPTAPRAFQGPRQAVPMPRQSRTIVGVHTRSAEAVGLEDGELRPDLDPIDEAEQHSEWHAHDESGHMLQDAEDASAFVSAISGGSAAILVEDNSASDGSQMAPTDSEEVSVQAALEGPDEHQPDTENALDENSPADSVAASECEKSEADFGAIVVRLQAETRARPSSTSPVSSLSRRSGRYPSELESSGPGSPVSPGHPAAASPLQQDEGASHVSSSVATPVSAAPLEDEITPPPTQPSGRTNDPDAVHAEPLTGASPRGSHARKATPLPASAQQDTALKSWHASNPAQMEAKVSSLQLMRHSKGQKPTTPELREGQPVPSLPPGMFRLVQDVQAEVKVYQVGADGLVHMQACNPYQSWAGMGKSQAQVAAAAESQKAVPRSSRSARGPRQSLHHVPRSARPSYFLRGGDVACSGERAPVDAGPRRDGKPQRAAGKGGRGSVALPGISAAPQSVEMSNADKLQQLEALMSMVNDIPDQQRRFGDATSLWTPRTESGPSFAVRRLATVKGRSQTGIQASGCQLPPCA